MCSRLAESPLVPSVTLSPWKTWLNWLLGWGVIDGASASSSVGQRLLGNAPSEEQTWMAHFPWTYEALPLHGSLLLGDEVEVL